MREVTNQLNKAPAGMRAITNEIKSAATIEMVLCTYRSHQRSLNDIHLSACWITLSRLSKKGAERKWLRTNQQTLGPLVQHTMRAARE